MSIEAEEEVVEEKKLRGAGNRRCRRRIARGRAVVASVAKRNGRAVIG